MSGLQIFGQISIYYVIANFKQHIFPLIATTRKVLTVLLSIAIYNHDINSYQWIAILIVFIGISF
jgi:UDP-galactose transporter B1